MAAMGSSGMLRLSWGACPAPALPCCSNKKGFPGKLSWTWVNRIPKHPHMVIIAG